MHKRLLALAIGALISSAHAQSYDDAVIQSTMGELANELQTIFPMIFIPEEELAQNQDKLKPKLQTLLKSFDRAQPHIEQRTLAFKASYNVMREHLKDTQSLMNSNQVVRASERLKALPSLCVSCHTQDAKQKRFFIGLDRSQFRSDYQFAEFSFATRDYGTAITYFDKFLTTPGVFKSEQHTQTALERLLTLFVQVDHEPTMAATYLEEYVPFIIDYPSIKVSLQSWVKDLKNLPENQKDLLSGKTTLNFERLENLAKTLEANKSSAGDDTVHYVIIRGLIHNYLNHEPKEDEIPLLLYWLALADKSLNYQYYHSFSDIYLKECFTSYPKHPYAQKCQKEYNDYTGLA